LAEDELATSALTVPRDAELVSGDLHVLGGVVPSDGRASWTAVRPGQFQPINAYVIQQGGVTLLIDTGVAAHESNVVGQLKRLVEPGRALSVFLTRPELECCSNLGAIAENYPVDALYTGGVINPFDGFDGVASREYHDRRVQFDRNDSGVIRIRDIEIFTGRTLAVRAAMLRLLPTFWLFDPATRALFTSDSFGHLTITGTTESRLLRVGDRDDSTVETAMSQLLTKFSWLSGAHLETIRADLVDAFDRFQPEIVAPTHGMVLVGRETVERHLGLVLEALESCTKMVDR
jgi:flavorubredoxin